MVLRGARVTKTQGRTRSGRRSPGPSCGSAAIGECKSGRRAPSGSWIRDVLVWTRIGSHFPAPPSLQSSPFPKAPDPAPTSGLSWSGLRLARGSHVTKASLSHPPRNAVPRAAAAAAWCCPQCNRGFAGRATEEQRLSLPRSCPAGWKKRLQTGCQNTVSFG